MVNQRDTIAAIASPPGRSLRGIIRVSGQDTYQALGTLCQPAPTAAGNTRCRIDICGAPLPAFLLTFTGPSSYTGEDAAELQLPGNPDVLTHVLELLCAQSNVRPANPGEFTARAHLNGKLTIEQAEGVAALIAAEDESQRNAAEDLLTGVTGDRYRALADDLAQTLALVEAGIDFTDQEDVVAITPTDLLDRLGTLDASIERLIGPTASIAKDTAPSILLLGAPNAGKSTLFNALLGRQRAIVSATPGTTRDVLREPIELGTIPATLVDLAGLDAALASRSSIDAESQQLARDAVRSASVVIVCDPLGRFELATLAPASAVTLRVRTKADLPTGNDDAITEGLRVCALDGWNLGALQRALRDACVAARGNQANQILPRHRAALELACAGIADGLGIAQHSAGHDRLTEEELIADPLRAALDALGAITGRISPDDVLGRIFSSFCIGK